MKAKALKKGDTIGIIAQSEPITDECIEDIKLAMKKLESIGFNIKFADHVFKNPTGYGETAEHKAEDINNMFLDKDVSAIFCAMGGYNCNSVFDYLDFDAIKNNPKIICRI